MLNIIKSKLSVSFIKKYNNNKNFDILNKYFSIRDWKTSIYTYNKNNLPLWPIYGNFIIKFIKSYFYLYNLKLEKKLRKQRLRPRSVKLSTNKIFFNDGEFKHTNDKVTITLYVYNRQKYNFLYILKKKYIRLFVKTKFLSKLNLIRYKGLEILKKQENLNKDIKKFLPLNRVKVNYLMHLYYKNYIKKALNRLKYYMFYKQLVYINQNKFNYSYLWVLIEELTERFEKNVELNLINLKYFYFNSNIFSQPLVLKLRRKRNLLRYLKACVRKVKIKKDNETLNKYFFDIKKFNFLENFFNENHINKFNSLLLSLLKQNEKISTINTYKGNLKYILFNNIKYKRVSGVRLEAAGRLTKRYTASRSSSKLIYKGNLENTLSSVNGHPSTVLRGNFKPNLEYTKIKSKSRIGSFGVKGWVSGV